MAVGFSKRLGELEELLAVGNDPLDALRGLGSPEELELLFRAQLYTLVRSGPPADDGEAGLDPRRLLTAAQRAALAGLLPLSAPGLLRRALDELEARLHAAGAWDRRRAPWWAPLPAPSGAERRWRALEAGRGWVSPPSEEALAAAFLGPGAPRSLVCPDFLSTALTRSLHRELTAARDGGLLGLEREGVGASGRLTARRSDRVRYLSGLEPELLDALPTLAALVQWGLQHLGERLAAARPGEEVFTPRSAMLACYPAPSAGYHPHLDNPGGSDDNGRSLTLVVYLNAPGEECAGGELALWAPGVSTEEAATRVARAASGTAAIFDARRVAHQVRSLEPGPERWALTFWLSDVERRRPAPRISVPDLSPTDALLPLASVPLPPGRLLFHELRGEAPAGEVVAREVPAERPRVGLVSTVYRSGSSLGAWCSHHLDAGVDHLVVIFDHLEEAAERADAERLRRRFPRDRLTIWAGEEMAETRWARLPPAARDEELLRLAGSGGACYAVAARQALNASAALEAARGDELGGAPLDWLIHLDADELLYLEGPARGGGDIGEHLAAAAAAGFDRLRWVNHELLLGGEAGEPARFKLNPRLAAARLGPVGWAKLVSHLGMSQDAARPYFTGYLNGKSAVRVAAAAAAAGVHGWRLSEPGTEASRVLAGPSVLHCHFGTPEGFRAKYLAAADAPSPPGPRPFEPSPVEVAALSAIRESRRAGEDEATLHRRLEDLHRRLTTFTAAEVELLEAAGLLISPRLPATGWGTPFLDG